MIESSGQIMQQGVQLGGALLLVVSFVLGQFERLAVDSWIYLAANLIGAVLMALTALRGAQWGFVLLESCWALVSFYGILRKVRRVPLPRSQSG